MRTEMSVPRVIVRPVWGTMIRIEVRDASANDATRPVWEWFRRVDELFSTWRDDSEISRLARGDLELTATNRHVRTVLALCDRLKAESRGAFDIAFAANANEPTLPGRCAIDPTGVVKGWAVDRAGELLLAEGVTDFAINAGGDILVRAVGRPPTAWRIGIQHPWERDKTAETVALANGAVATSGNYERGDHVVNARSGRPAVGLAAVTVVASELVTADGYATAALALGRDGMPWLATVPGIVAIGITDDRRVVKTAGFDDVVMRR